jgi:hypothetical protein
VEHWEEDNRMTLIQIASRLLCVFVCEKVLSLLGTVLLLSRGTDPHQIKHMQRATQMDNSHRFSALLQGKKGGPPVGGDGHTCHRQQQHSDGAIRLGVGSRLPSFRFQRAASAA